ncbi:putative 2OG-Fe(II) oxygenase [Qipengyuania seohaensis]|uniref:putative 2OG-Fe(II) oxygenase n=1 Tax=Qipengyuania seohaensis TaxID=266951 RepID=UPI0038CD4493
MRTIGSWSILLRAEGHQTDRARPDGPLGSAHNIALPERYGPSSDEGVLASPSAPRGPGIEQEALRSIAPQQGRLALFQPIVFHGTTPFTAGERLSVAFDIAQ